jgi:hypothetical protein
VALSTVQHAKFGEVLERAIRDVDKGEDNDDLENSNDSFRQVIPLNATRCDDFCNHLVLTPVHPVAPAACANHQRVFRAAHDSSTLLEDRLGQIG